MGPDFQKFKIRKIMNLPDSITFLNLLSGMAAIFLSIERKFFSASLMMLAAIIMDYFDGKAARLLNQKTDFGKQIDSLADLISFGAAPVIFGLLYYRYVGLNIGFILFLSAALFMIAGATRLAQYNVIDYRKGFIGMPITVNGFLFPLLYFTAFPMAYLPIIYMIAAVLMVSNITFRRLP